MRLGWFCFLITMAPYALWAQLPELPYAPASTPLPEWVALLYSDTAHPTAVATAYDHYYDRHPFVKNQHTQYYKRWQHQLGRMPYWKGMSTHEQRHYRQQQQRYQAAYRQLHQQRSTTTPWRSLGPFTFDKTAASTSYACGAAHIFTVERAPSTPQTLYAGSATAGIWRSVDGGQHWDLTTASLPITTVRALAIDPFSATTVYAASDLDGVLYKTTNGGASWNSIGDAAFQQLNHQISDIVIHPQFSNIVWVASSQGLYRSTNSGSSWTSILPHPTQEIEVQPGQPNTIYAVAQVGTGTQFFKSTDAGATFVHKPNGWPVPTILDEQRRTEIAISAADPNRVYALCAGAVGFGSGLYGIYVSNDAGETWSARCCGAHLPNYLTAANPNLLHWSTAGTGNGGQYYYDLALTASPTNADSVWLAGINLWVSGDGANTFTCPAPWSASNQANYVHADIHDLRHYGSELWVACDGGIFYTNDNGQTMQPRQTGIQGTDFWGFGAGLQDGDVLLGGTFHNGTLLRDGNVYQGGWLSTNGGDNYRGYVHPVLGRLVYSDYGQTTLSGDRTVPNLLAPFNKLPHATRTVGLSGNLAVHPERYRTLYSTDYDQLWRSDDQGETWTLVADFGSGLLTSLHIAWRNPNILYLHHHPPTASAERRIYRSADGGSTWTNITPDSTLIPQDRWVGYDLALDAKNPQRLWAVRVSPYEGTPILDGAQVFESNDGGQTWINRTTPALNGVYGTNLVHQRGSNGGLYLGTRRGVHYIDDQQADWTLYNCDLPARTFSVKLVPNYKKGTLTNGTSRSVYEVDFFAPSPPVAQISVDRQQAFCPRDTFHFAHQSATDSAATYHWQFEQGTPAQSNAPYPKVQFPSAGSYSVTLTVTTTHGSDTQVLPQFITLHNKCEPDTIPGLALALGDRFAYAQTPPFNRRFTHLTLSAWVHPDSIPAPRTGLLTHNSDTTPAGLLLNDSGELSYCWGNCRWNWNSGLTLPPDQWSHVALVVTPDSVQVYLNGISHTFVAPTPPLEWNGDFVMGRYANWQSRTFKGWMDEVCVWDTALTTQQLRERRHLTRYLAQEPRLLHYYQFNHLPQSLQDKKGTLHGRAMGSAQGQPSTAPVGGGQRQHTNTLGTGRYDWTAAYMGMQFGIPAPSGPWVANRLNIAPDTAPSPSTGYWISNHYGAPDSVQIDSLWLTLPAGEQFLAGWHHLYRRSANAHGPTWGAPIDSLWLGAPSPQLAFGGWGHPLPLGQWLVASDSALVVAIPPQPLPSFTPKATLYPNPIQAGQRLYLQLPTDEEYTLTLCAPTGQAVARHLVRGPRPSVQLPPLEAGWYGYRLTTERWRQVGWLQYAP